MLKLNPSSQANKFLKNLPPKQKKQLGKKIEALRKDPYPHDSKEMKGYFPFRRADCGEYRIVYKSDDEILYLTVVGKRNDDEVYKIFKRKM